MKNISWQRGGCCKALSQGWVAVHQMLLKQRTIRKDGTKYTGIKSEGIHKGMVGQLSEKKQAEA